jgi:hypothetical protein
VVSIDAVETNGGVSVVLPSTSVVLGFQFRGRERASDDYLALAGVTGIGAAPFGFPPCRRKVSRRNDHGNGLLERLGNELQRGERSRLAIGEGSSTHGCGDAEEDHDVQVTR